MDKEFGRKLVEATVKCHKALDAAEELARGCQDEAERTRFRLAIAQASGQLYTDVILEIIRQYPDLDPYPRGS